MTGRGSQELVQCLKPRLQGPALVGRWMLLAWPRELSQGCACKASYG